MSRGEEFAGFSSENRLGRTVFEGSPNLNNFVKSSTGRMKNDNAENVFENLMDSRTLSTRQFAKFADSMVEPET